MQTARALSWKKLFFVTNWCFIPRESCCLTHASPNFAICTRLSNPFAIQIFSWAWPRARSKNAVRERFTLGVRGATVNEAKIEGAREIEIFQFNGVLLGRGWLCCNCSCRFGGGGGSSSCCCCCCCCCCSCLSIYLIHRFIYLFIYLSVCLSIYISVYLQAWKRSDFARFPTN